MKQIFKIILVLILCSSFYSCKKNKVGGKATLKGIVSHHNKPIPNAYVYIKYNTSEFPGADYTLYDTYVQADSEGNYSIDFYKGTYYIFAYGYDLAIAAPYVVKGGLSISIRNREHLVKDIAVTE